MSYTNSKYIIRLVLKGWTNRPFFHIAVAECDTKREDPYIEQIGSYDPLPNYNNEKLVAINFERLNYWMSQSIIFTVPVAELLGYAGYTTIHPRALRRIRNKIISPQSNDMNKENQDKKS